MLFGIKVSKSYIGGEGFFMISENIRITRGLTARLMGAHTQERIFKFHERINNLGLNDREMSLFMPTISTYSSKNKNLTIKIIYFIYLRS